MLMRGDLNKIITQFNELMESAYARIQALEDKIQLMEEGSKPAKPEPKRVSSKKTEETEAA